MRAPHTKLDAPYSPLTANEMETHNRPDEWKIEQGLSGAKLPILDQTGPETIAIEPRKWPELVKDEAAIKAVGDPNELFARELEGWIGYVVIR
jgi:sulfite oxidase